VFTACAGGGEDAGCGCPSRRAGWDTRAAISDVPVKSAVWLFWSPMSPSAVIVMQSEELKSVKAAVTVVVSASAAK